MYYAYWSDLPRLRIRDHDRAQDCRGWAAIPTHDDLTVLPFGWPVEEFKENRGDIEGNFLAAMDLAPEFAERVRGATRESKFVGSAELPGYFRKPYGPGWALVGMPATTRTRSRRWASTTPFAMPSSWPAPWTMRSRGAARTKRA